MNDENAEVDCKSSDMMDVAAAPVAAIETGTVSCPVPLESTVTSPVSLVASYGERVFNRPSSDTGTTYSLEAASEAVSDVAVRSAETTAMSRCLRKEAR